MTIRKIVRWKHFVRVFFRLSRNILRNSEFNFFIDFPRNSEQSKSMTVQALMLKKTRTHKQLHVYCGMPSIASVSLTSNLSSNFHGFWRWKILPTFLKISACVIMCSHRLKSFFLFRFHKKILTKIHVILNLKFLYIFFHLSLV